MKVSYSKFRFKTVSVRAYRRFRFGKWEYVKIHKRGKPKRRFKPFKRRAQTSFSSLRCKTAFLSEEKFYH